MANENKPLSPPVAAQGLSVEDQIKALQLKKLMRDLEQEDAERAEFDRKERIRKEAALKEIAFTQQAELEKLANQAACPHMAHNGIGGVSFIRGQKLGMTKDENGNTKEGFLAFCQLCKKSYDKWDDIPPHLRSDREYFGGPKSY